MTVHSPRAVQAEQDSEYSSDEVEDECTSDQDDRGPAYESDDDDGYDRIANDATSMRSCAALTTKMPRLSRSRVTSSPFPLALLDPTLLAL